MNVSVMPDVTAAWMDSYLIVLHLLRPLEKHGRVLLARLEAVAFYVLSPVSAVRLRLPNETDTYTVPVVVLYMLLLEGTLDLLLSILREGVETVDELHVHLRSLGPIVEDLWRHAAPGRLLAMLEMLRVRI